jgi:hypothetical protein
MRAPALPAEGSARELPHPSTHPRRKLPPAVKHGPVTGETADISGDACAGRQLGKTEAVPRVEW